MIPITTDNHSTGGAVYPRLCKTAIPSLPIQYFIEFDSDDLFGLYH